MGSGVICNHICIFVQNQQVCIIPFGNAFSNRCSTGLQPRAPLARSVSCTTLVPELATLVPDLGAQCNLRNVGQSQPRPAIFASTLLHMWLLLMWPFDNRMINNVRSAIHWSSFFLIHYQLMNIAVTNESID